MHIELQTCDLLTSKYTNLLFIYIARSDALPGEGCGLPAGVDHLLLPLPEGPQDGGQDPHKNTTVTTRHL